MEGHLLPSIWSAGGMAMVVGERGMGRERAVPKTILPPVS